MNYYISDLHIGCTNSFDGRTLEHDEILVKNWNSVVHNNDKVYVLGDIGRIGGNTNNEYLCSVISRLKGHKILIMGNHDELIISCRCGCDEGIHFKIHDYEDGDYAFLAFTNGNFYTQQHPFKEKVIKIWNIIRNRDYYYSDIVMTKDDFEQFKEWINRK